MAFDVIIIDDDDVAIFILEKLVIGSGFHEKPIAFQQARNALDYIYKNDSATSNFIVLLDINMPDINGWDFLDIINNKPINGVIHVAIVTSSIDSYDKELASKYPQIIRFFEKPLTFDDLKIFKSILPLQ